MKHAILALIAISLALLPAAAAISTVAAGGAVFIGEQGLDISATLGANTHIAWFPSTAVAASAVPEKVIDVASTMTDFYVNPTDFTSRSGTWFSWSDGQTVGTSAAAFRVTDPYLSIRVRDTTVDADATNSWIFRGDTGGFSIETNLHFLKDRGVAGAPMTIKVQSPEGNVYSSLLDPAGTPQPLGITVPSSPYTVPGVAWDTGNSLYAPGEYRVWAECNANGMKDNYPVTGKTVSPVVSVRVQRNNPLIREEVAITAGTPATAATTAPKTTSTPAATTPPATAATPSPSAPPTPAPVDSATSATESIPATPQPTRAPGFGTVAAAIAAGAAFLAVPARRR